MIVSVEAAERECGDDAGDDEQRNQHAEAEPEAPANGVELGAIERAH